MSRKTMTLCIIYKNGKVLLAMKKRGFGEGKWNGFGGKVLPDETIEQAMLRECLEEARIKPLNYEEFAIFEFNFPSGKENLNCEVHVFKARDLDSEPQETDEMRPQWFLKNEIPYDKMWSPGKHWLKLFLQGKKLKGEFYFDDNDNLEKHFLQEVEELI